MGLILGAVLFAVLAVTAARAWRGRRNERTRPGGTPERAIAVRDFAEIDSACREQTCACGGHFTLRGEGPSRHGGRSLRQAVLECARCEREQRLYFDLSELRH